MDKGAIIYDSPIGPMPGGAPSGDAAAGLLGQALTAAATGGIPIPNINLGQSGPAVATGGTSKSMVYNVSGGSGMLLLLAVAGIAGLALWRLTK